MTMIRRRPALALGLFIVGLSTVLRLRKGIAFLDEIIDNEKLMSVVAPPRLMSTTAAAVHQRPRTQTPNKQNPPRDVNFLDLIDWELESLKGITSRDVTVHEAKASCRPPPGIPDSCCPGSTGGRTDCAGKSVELYTSLRDTVLQQLQPMGCDVCRIVTLLKEHNITFGIWGDSVTRQSMEALECELLRRGYNVTKTAIPRGRMTLAITSPGDGEPVLIHWYIQWKILPDLRNPDAPGNDPDVNAVLVSFGLHWSKGPVTRRQQTPEHYRARLESLFQHLYEQRHRFRLILHRETSAQHFDGDGGDFFIARAANRSSTCVPMIWGGNAGWRESYVRDSATKNGFEVVSAAANHRYPPAAADRTELIVLPFFNHTASLHDFHPWLGAHQGKAQDCTHFCSVPYMWWPLWRSLRVALDERLPE